jgi:hypothetical protein
MKNILNKLGYITKPAMVGIALGVATVAVGIGVLTQFTGDKGGGGISGSALGQYGGTLASSAGNSGTYSREALEASMAAAEAARQQGDSVYSLKGAGGDFYYGKNAEQQRQMAANAAVANGAEASGNEGVDGEGKALQGMGIGGMGVGGIAAVEGSNAMDPTAEAAKAAALQKAGAAQAAALSASGGANAGGMQLRTSQMAGAGGSGGSSGGSVTMLGAASESGSGTRAIAQAPAGSVPNQHGDIEAFKGGRAGAMGGSNVRGGRGGGLGEGQQGAGVGGALMTSYNRTNMARGTVMGDVGKGAADAASAFDGSVEAEAIPVGEGNIRAATVDALSAGTGLKPTMNAVKAKLTDVNQNVETAKDLKKKITGKLLLAGVIVAGLCFAIGAAVKAGGPWGYIGAAVATVAALTVIWTGLGVWGLLKDLKNLPYGLSGGYGLMLGITIAAQVLMTAAVGLAWFLGSKGAAASKAATETATTTAAKSASLLTKAGISLATSMAGTMAQQGISSLNTSSSTGTYQVDSKGNPVDPGPDASDADRMAYENAKNRG